MLTDEPRVNFWKWIAAALVLSAVGVGVTFSAWADIVDIAIGDEESSHIWLVPILVVWLAGVYRDRLVDYRPHLDPIGAGIILVGWAISTYGFYNQVQSFRHGGAVLLVVGCFLFVTGMGFARRMPAVFVALVFLIPVPGMVRQEIAIPLQTATAAASQFVFELFAIPVERSGNLLQYNGIDINVAEACNGMRLVFTLLSVCYVFAFATRLYGWVRVLVLALSPVVAIVCNVLRVIPTIWVYGHYSEDVATTFHDLSGWVMIFVSFMILVGFVRLLDWAQIPIRPPEDGDDGVEVQTQPPVRVRRGQFGVSIAAVVVAFTVVVVEGTTRPVPADAEAYHERVLEASKALPTAFGDWVGEPVEVPQAAITLLQPNVIISEAFHNKKTGEDVSLLIVHCKDARYLAGHYPPKCYPGVGWVGEGQADELWKLREQSIEGVSYRFVRGIGSRQHGMVVANLLVMPTGEFLRSMKGVRYAAADYASHFFGAAQIQVVMSSSMGPKRRHEIVTEFFEAHWPVIAAMIDAPELTSSSLSE